MNKLPPFANLGIKPLGAQAPPGSVGLGDQFETQLVQVPVVTESLVTGQFMRRTSVALTSRAWTGIDVSIDTSRITPPAGGGFCLFSVLVFARSQGASALVGTGRGGLVSGSNVVCSARTSRTIYEVFVSLYEQNPVVRNGEESISLSLSASDAMGGQLAWAGMQPSNGLLQFNVPSQIPRTPAPELLSFAAGNDSAAVKFIQLVRNVPGATAVIEWMLPATIGASLVVPDLRYRAAENLCLLASSTQGTYTPATAEIALWYR